jgi:metal-responsive CopG/Arc/MetJ family transcriptional regulator
MANKRVPVLIPTEMLRNLDKLAERYAMDRSSAIRYCLARTFEEEGVTPQRNAGSTKKVNSN